MSRPRILRIGAALGLVAVLLVIGLVERLRGEAPRPRLVVRAAASLSDVLPRVAAGWDGGAVDFAFDASSRLARQIEAGAPTDVFFSADREWMDHLDGRGLLAPGTRRDLLGNELVLVVPQGAAFVPAMAAELSSPRLERLALAGEAVPAGRYARAALGAAGVWEAVSGRVVSGDTVRTALGWVARGEAGAAVVYATDARVEPRARVAFVFPASSHPPIVYPAAVVRGAPLPAEARRFLEHCRGAAAQALFGAAGFRILDGGAR